ncbi:MAG: M20/M25/M40 family metallo-hydrolase [Firmicutes bacterium]|nr:M20/M25/M40 family metallo-hydrolase [Bacillota bacterium]
MKTEFYIFLAFVSLFFLLILIAIIRTFFTGNSLSKPVKKDISLEFQLKYAKGLQKLIQIKTISNRENTNLNSFEDLQKVITHLFPLIHLNLEQTKFDDGSFIYKWIGTTHNYPILLMAHQDVVPVDELNWKHTPFSGVIEHDTIIGRGTIDTKSTLYAIFQAVEELLSENFVPSVDIYLASSSNEEVSGNGAKITVDWLANQNIILSLVLDEGGVIVENAFPSMKKEMALVGVLEKGYVNLLFKAKSNGGHSSIPSRHSPIARLSEFVMHIERKFPLKTKMINEVKIMFEIASSSMSFWYRFIFGNMWLFKGFLTKILPSFSPYGRAFLSTTIAFTMSKGSDQENVIPSEAYLLANLRTHPIQGIQDSVAVLTKIAKKYDIECEIMNGREASPITDINSAGYIYLTKQIQTSFPDVLISPYIVLGGTDARHYRSISDSILRFSPLRVSQAELQSIHGNDERLKLSSLAQAVKFYEDFMRNY